MGRGRTLRDDAIQLQNCIESIPQTCREGRREGTPASPCPKDLCSTTCIGPIARAKDGSIRGHHDCQAQER
ncbi:hypothetical protein ACHAXS_003518 [Conticribra weissflogii]